MSSIKQQWAEAKEYDRQLDLAGYKSLGYQNGWQHVYFDEHGNVTEDKSLQKTFGYLTADYPEYGKCKDAKHKKIEKQHTQSGSNNTVHCETCKIYYKYDCSD